MKFFIIGSFKKKKRKKNYPCLKRNLRRNNNSDLEPCRLLLVSAILELVNICLRWSTRHVGIGIDRACRRAGAKNLDLVRWKRAGRQR